MTIASAIVRPAHDRSRLISTTWFVANGTNGSEISWSADNSHLSFRGFRNGIPYQLKAVPRVDPDRLRASIAGDEPLLCAARHCRHTVGDLQRAHERAQLLEQRHVARSAVVEPHVSAERRRSYDGPQVTHAAGVPAFDQSSQSGEPQREGVSDARRGYARRLHE